ncbi:hypothetical protein BC834DRAFT_567843 [Gloeopeniophorella convolvens]|nr:hypothetical protein BC834DRAFT_567843 [Gloeopeniophorella convolvens]
MATTAVFAQPPAYSTPAVHLDADDVLGFRPSSSTPPPAYTERASRKFRITAAPGAGVLNASIVDGAGRALYTASSDAKLKKTSVRRPDTGVELASFEWDRASPRMRLAGKKLKCKEWLPLSADTRSRILTLDGIRYILTDRKGVGYLMPAQGPVLLPLARWRTTHDVRAQRVEVFEDALVVPGLLDALVLALLVLQGAQPLGDAFDCLNSASPKFYGAGDLAWR